jgi:hypothetical protein
MQKKYTFGDPGDSNECPVTSDQTLAIDSNDMTISRQYSCFS